MLRIELKQEALFACVDTGRREIRFIDVGNHPVPAAAALAEPGKLGGIYFLNRTRLAMGTGVSRCLPDGIAAPYREIYLGNESMVERWSGS